MTEIMGGVLHEHLPSQQRQHLALEVVERCESMTGVPKSTEGVRIPYAAHELCLSVGLTVTFHLEKVLDCVEDCLYRWESKVTAVNNKTALFYISVCGILPRVDQSTEGGESYSLELW